MAEAMKTKNTEEVKQNNGKFAILTSGGDAPGMNAAVMAAARTAAKYGMTLIGIKRGYNGTLKKNINSDDYTTELTLETVLDIADLPGTYLRTARCKEFVEPDVQKQAADNLREMGVEGLIVLGGDGSFQGAMRLCDNQIPCIGVPATIDNDLAYTEMTLGFDTAVNTCVEAIRAVRATCRSHDRFHIVEVMGRHCGDIALASACATGSEIVVVPEVAWSVEELYEHLLREKQKGNLRPTIVFAEGSWESMAPFDMGAFLKAHNIPYYEGEPMTVARLAQILECMGKKDGLEGRSTVIGYTQRGANPTARDCMFAFKAGNMAVELLHEGKSNEVIGMQQGKVMHMPIKDALAVKVEYDRSLYDTINGMEKPAE